MGAGDCNFCPGSWEKAQNPQTVATTPSLRSADGKCSTTCAAPFRPQCFLVDGWVADIPAAAWRWTGFVLLTISIPPLLPCLFGIRPSPWNFRRSHCASCQIVPGCIADQLTVTFLAHQAWLMSDAIVAYSWPVSGHAQSLLEWVTAAQLNMPST
jgi:hypothetical protein